MISALRAGLILAAAVCVTLLAAAAEKVKIVASFSILGDMVEQVAGEHAQVTTIVGPDADAHVYQPSISDARAVAKADIIFVNGLGFETWSDTLIAESGTEATIHVATHGIAPIEVEGGIDPHAWNSLTNGMIYIRNIETALSAAMPEHAADFAANASAFVAEIEALDAETRAKLTDLPASKRTIVTAHDAFGYLADAYGLNFLAPVGIDTEAEASARDVAVLIDQINAEGAAALFVENITSPALVEQISAETGIAVGGRLYSDALSERGGPATGYLAMYRHNLTTLVNALGQHTPG